MAVPPRSALTDPLPATRLRPRLQGLEPYVPGEQPEGADWIKLNTNENPHGPSPRVREAIRKAVGDNLRRYPSPDAGQLRRRLAARHGCDPDSIVVGNGSDELLALATRAFVEPPEGRIQYFTPSYSLYPVLAAIQGAGVRAVPLEEDFSLPREGAWRGDAALGFITTPNAPGGRVYAARELERFCRKTRGVVVLDEAYADFAPCHALELALRLDNVLVARTFSKGWSLCALRIGYMVGHPELIGALHRIRDSYNVNGLAQVAALSSLDDEAWYRERQQSVIEERERLGERLVAHGFEVLPSGTNFLLTAPPPGTGDACSWQARLREERILVRWFSVPGIERFLRITVGSPRENRRLLEAAGRIVKRA